MIFYPLILSRTFTVDLSGLQCFHLIFFFFLKNMTLLLQQTQFCAQLRGNRTVACWIVSDPRCTLLDSPDCFQPIKNLKKMLKIFLISLKKKFNNPNVPASCCAPTNHLREHAEVFEICNVLCSFVHLTSCRQGWIFFFAKTSSQKWRHSESAADVSVSRQLWRSRLTVQLQQNPSYWLVLRLISSTSPVKWSCAALASAGIQFAQMLRLRLRRAACSLYCLLTSWQK